MTGTTISAMLIRPVNDGGETYVVAQAAIHVFETWDLRTDAGRRSVEDLTNQMFQSIGEDGDMIQADVDTSGVSA